VVGAIVYAAGASSARATARAAEGFAWVPSLEDGIARAKAEGRPVIIDFWASWCVACKELDRIAWSDERVRAEASRFVAVKLDGSEEDEAFVAIAERFRVPGMPTVIFLDGKGREVPDRVMGAIGADEMIERLRAVDGACDAPRRAPVAPAAVACAARW
jgi:thiol:disulfide interchange protein DsbD